MAVVTNMNYDGDDYGDNDIDVDDEFISAATYWDNNKRDEHVAWQSVELG